jgi:hypothetical protein
MKLSMNPNIAASASITAEWLVLAAWYDSQPAVRRLWAVKNSQKLRVIVAIEATADNDDVYPVWLANTETWASELHAHTGSPVQLELIHEAPLNGIEVDADSTIVADLFWRDATL